MIRLFFSLCIISSIYGQTTEQVNKKTYPLLSSAGLKLLNVKTAPVEHSGKKGIEVTRSKTGFDYETLVIIPDIDFVDGTIEVELSGERSADSDPNMRGFVGIAFRVNPDNYSEYECLYLRPANGRADNQVQRNHSTQYISHPEYPWYRMRKENPELYESYVDLVPGEWTKIKIEVRGQTAQLFVHDAQQPVLIVNNLKKESRAGKIALWLHTTTLARYRNLVVTTK